MADRKTLTCLVADDHPAVVEAVVTLSPTPADLSALSDPRAALPEPPAPDH